MNAYLILGNGVSIDFITHLGKTDDISLFNLFCNGDKVKWPVGNKQGFLSYKHCPALSRLGANPTNSPQEALKIIENVITCANVYASLDVSKRPRKKNDGVEGIYLKAYNELVAYLRQLFIYYNDLVIDDDFKDIEKWEWSKLFINLNNSSAIERVYIITYNYDIWIERVLEKLKIEYSTYLGTDNKKKFLLLKPHGSISFIHNKTNDIDAFELKNSFEHTDAEIIDFKEDLVNLLCNPTVIPLIPPAGQSSRYKNSWAANMRNKIIEECKSSSKEDYFIIAGISYWFVDREEIDEIITNLHSDANLYIANPKPPDDFLAVLTTIFRNVIHFPKCKENLGEIL